MHIHGKILLLCGIEHIVAADEHAGMLIFVSATQCVQIHVLVQFLRYGGLVGEIISAKRSIAVAKISAASSAPFCRRMAERIVFSSSLRTLFIALSSPFPVLTELVRASAHSLHDSADHMESVRHCPLE